jgi:hypothetical protein
VLRTDLAAMAAERDTLLARNKELESTLSKAPSDKIIITHVKPVGASATSIDCIFEEI